MTYYHRRLSSFPLIMQKLLVHQPNEKKEKNIPKCFGINGNKSLLLLLCFVAETLLKFSPVTGNL